MKRDGGAGLRLLVALGILVGIGVLIWGLMAYRGGLPPWLGGVGGEPEAVWAVPSPQAARGAWDEVEAFLKEEASGQGAEIRLSPTQLASLAAYQLSDLVPAPLSGLRLRTDGDLLILQGDLERTLLEGRSDAEAFIRLLPDTIPVEAQVRLVPGDPGTSVLRIERFMASGIPVPSRLHPAVLEVLASRGGFQLQGGDLLVTLPPGLTSISIAEGHVRLKRRH